MALMLIAIWFQTPAPSVPHADAEAIMALHQQRTSARVACTTTADADETVVCARRGADRDRVPLVVYDMNDPRRPDALGERERLIAQRSPCQEMGPYLVGCGHIGVTLSSRTGLSGSRQRPLAP
ncbi:hypothetical protein ACNI3Q_04315 [Sphingomonas sp. FW199]|uniref:hypothetical protein n=1 Tax=Sphingomonas sp. FW199 TaxID=3400217 RepID=UPI003CF53648